MDAAQAEPKAAETLRGILDRMGLRAQVESRVEEDRVVLDLRGDDVAVAIGAKGRTLDALQFLVGRIVNRGAERAVPILVDGAGYRARREDALREMALRLRDKALATRRPVTVQGMNAAERRVIHRALGEAGGVTTRSDGEEPYRCLVITPTSDSQSTPSG